MNKLEEKTLEQIKELNEGILSSIAKMFVRNKVKSKYKKAYAIAKDDPPLIADHLIDPRLIGHEP